MKPLLDLRPNGIEIVLTDIDDTLTDQGKLRPEAWTALWKLADSGKRIVPVTGRPAGWCEMIARFWPVHGVVGENGAFYFRYTGGKMKRVFSVDEPTRARDQARLRGTILPEILQTVPGCAVASDQFCRISDLAIDFCEDVPALDEKSVAEIVHVFQKHGAVAKVSSIHVNGWFGSFDKLTMIQRYLTDELGYAESDLQKKCVFSGDSPNDEPMFGYFKNSVGVANIQRFAANMKSPPAYITKSTGGSGFAELAAHLLE